MGYVYHGSGDNEILKILIKDINECETYYDDCDLNAVCENNEGSFSCECRGPLFYGSGKAWDRMQVNLVVFARDIKKEQR